MKCLVLSGGAEKGIGYLGIIQYLEEVNILSGIETFYGTSVGAILSTLISIGYSSKELLYIIKKMNIKELLIGSDFDLAVFLEKFGFFEPNKIIRLIQLLIKKKTGIDNMTFLEHYNKYSKGLFITGSCISNYTCEYFNYIDNPNMSIIDAIRISISIPFLFKPCIYGGKYYLDGALYDNYPVGHAMQKYRVEEIIGCFINLKFTEEGSIENIDHFLKVCIRSISVKFNYLFLNLFKECSIIIECDRAYYDLTSQEEIDNFVHVGYQSAKSHIEKRLQKPNIKLNSLSDKDIQL